MSKIEITIIAFIILIIGLMFYPSVAGCKQWTAKNFGGSIAVDLEPGYKLVNITWKDDGELWYLTRPMRTGEIPEVYAFKEQSKLGMLQGNVKISEHEKSK